jgi:hypothetical protein
MFFAIKKNRTLFHNCYKKYVNRKHKPVGYTRKHAEHTQAFFGKPGSKMLKLAIRVKWYHEAHLGFD